MQNYLKGEALEVIKSFSIASENYAPAWDSLKLFYENEHRQVHKRLSNLFAVKPMIKNSYFEIRRLLNETFTSLDALTALGRPIKSLLDILVYMLVNNVDKATRLDWEKNLGRTVLVPSLDRVKTFLQVQALIYESMQGSASILSSSSMSNKKAGDSSSQGYHQRNASVNKPKLVATETLPTNDSTPTIQIVRSST